MNQKKYSVIVIGGGMSGLSCCSKLIENGIKNILLIEANNRLGGRIHTIEYDNSHLELGAQWIHGKKNNPIYPIAKSLNNIDEKSIPETYYYADQTGQQYDEDQIDRIERKIENIFDNLEDYIENELEEDSDQSLGALLQDGFNKVVKRFDLKQNNIELIKAVYRTRLNEEKHEVAWDDLNKISALAWNEYEDFDDEHFNRLKHGYIKLIDYLSSFISKENIKLNEAVEKINWSSDGAFINTYNTVDQKHYEYKSDIVCVTLPVGILKKSANTLFSPALPNNKIRLFEHLGFGCLNKIFIVFDRPINAKDFAGFQILWRDDFIGFELEANKKWNLKNQNFFKSFDTFDLLPNNKNVLISFLNGNDAIYSETLEDECLLDIIYELLTKAFPQFNIQKPKQIVRSKWNSNQFSLGSYSFVKPGGLNECKVYSQPVNNVLYFAGEAANPRYLGTVHGAYISGRETANKITKNLNEINKR